MMVSDNTEQLSHRLNIANALPWYVLVALALGLIALTLRALWATRGRRGAKRLALLRGMGIALTIAVGLLPEWITERRLTTQPHVALVVDDSPSMAVALGGEPERLKTAQAWADAAMASQSGVNARTVSLHSLQALTNSGHSDLQGGLEALMAQSEATSGPRPDAIVLLSDGADNGMLTAGDNDGDADGHGNEHAATSLSAQTIAKLRELSVPVSTYTLLGPSPWRDVAIDAVHFDPYGFIKNTLHVDVTLNVEGDVPAKTPLAVSLQQDGQVVARAIVPAQQGQTRARLSFVPKTVGSFTYRVEVAAVEGEVSQTNNTVSYVARVVRDKMRVLHVAGRPCWDQRFLRETLKAHPQVDVVSFYILRTPYSDNAVPEGELSLIPFPVDRLFTTELHNFDVVVFQNFDFRPFRMEGYLPNLAQAIDQGLGFMMVGGADSFGQAGYGGTPLETMLPTAVGGADLWPGLVHLEATQQGARHPLLDLCPGKMAGSSCFDSLPPLRRINPLGAVKPHSMVLAQAVGPAAKGGHRPTPLLVAAESGKGRTLALATDTLWHWRVQDGPLSVAAKVYDKFWHQALLWLTHDAQTLPLQVVPAKYDLAVGEPIDVAITLLQPPDAAAERPSIALTLAPLSDTTSAAQPICVRQVDQDGQTSCRTPGLPQGSYRLVGKTQGPNGHEALEAQAVIVVQNHNREHIRLRSQPTLMARIARATGGKVLSERDRGDAAQSVPVAPPQAPIVLGESRTPLWDNGYVLACMCTLWGLEVVLRRRMGLR